VREAVSESRETTFDRDVADPARLEAVLLELTGQLCAGLRGHGRRGRTIRIKVRLDDFTTVTRARTIEAPTDEAAVVAEVAVGLLRAYAPARPVRLLGVGVTGFSGEAPAAGERGQLALPL
jgi:DNA polymerase-4